MHTHTHTHTCMDKYEKHTSKKIKHFTLTALLLLKRLNSNALEIKIASGKVYFVSASKLPF